MMRAPAPVFTTPHRISRSDLVFLNSSIWVGLPVLRDVWASIVREVVLAAVFFLPRARKKRIERWLRGRKEYRRIHDADLLLVSWGKSGRTWLRLMVSRFYQLHFGLPEGSFLQYDNLKRLDSRIPSVYFTHGNYLRDYTGNGYDTKVDFVGKRIVLLVRDPRDIAVSQYFQWKHRMLPRKKWLNDYPEHGEDVSIYEFMTNEQVGLPHVISYLNGWARGAQDLGSVLVVRYEDLRADPHKKLAEVLEFMGTPGDSEEVAGAVEYAAFENMRKLETGGSFRHIGRRLLPGSSSNPDSYKVRRAKVGGYRDYFDAEQLAEIDRMFREDFTRYYGYEERGGDA